MYFLMAFIFHLFDIHSEYPYSNDDTVAPEGHFKCCICKKSIPRKEE
jgi:hypothetical protein